MAGQHSTQPSLLDHVTDTWRQDADQLTVMDAINDTEGD